jgi:hypothetical protein
MTVDSKEGGEYPNSKQGKHYCLCPVRNDIYNSYKLKKMFEK